MRRIVVVLALCGIGSLAFAASALAGGSASTANGANAAAQPAAKTPKPMRYEICGSEAGCGFEVSLFKKSKTFVEGGGEEGTFITGPKGLLEMNFNNGCKFVLHKVKKTKNYSGEEPPGGPGFCYVQTIELKRL